MQKAASTCKDWKYLGAKTPTIEQKAKTAEK